MRATITNIRPGQRISATLTVGYHLGYPIALAPGGVKISMKTPELRILGGLSAKLAPSITISPTGGGGSVGDIGGNVGVEATVLPSHSAEFTLGAGGIRTVTVAKLAMTTSLAEIMLSGTHISVSNAFGSVKVRPFATLTVTMQQEIYDLSVYGTTTRL